MVVAAPALSQILEQGRRLGTTNVPVVLSVGRHQLDVVNEEMGFRAQHTVTIADGERTDLAVEWPNALLSIDAQPWAEVWINGEQVGETPIGNLSRPIGPYEVLFRHPTLGERRRMLVLRSGEPARVSVDLMSGS